MFKVIIDSGATKADWCAFDGLQRLVVKTSGMNLSTMSQDAVNAVASDGVTGLGLTPDSVAEVHFYAAGLLAGSPAAEAMGTLLRERFPCAYVECASDLMAAARAVCGHSPGIAAILGTGSNSCLYDGENIVRNVRSGGFILGDEGGGACLGKLFVSDFLKGLVPDPLASEFASSFDVDYMTVVKNVYRSDSPSAYLGSFAPWILSHAGNDVYARFMVERNISDFIHRVLAQYDLNRHSVGFVGGFACACAPVLRRLAGDEGFSISTILQSPLDKLVEYHS